MEKQKLSKLDRKIATLGVIIMIPATLFLIFTLFVPICWNIVLSFCEWNGNGAITFVGLENYIDVFTDKSTLSSLYNSLFIAAVSTVVAMVLGVSSALLIYPLKGKESAFYRFVFFAPSMLPMTVIGLLFTFILSSSNGLLNLVLTAIGLGDLTHAWLSDPSTVLWTIGIIHGWRFSGMIMILVFGGLVGIPESLFESAKLEGTTYLTEIRYIIFPLAKSTIKLALSMMLVWSFKTYGIVWSLTKGGPGDLSTTAPILMIKEAFSLNNFGGGAAIGIVLSAMVMCCIVVGRRAMKGETYEY